MSLAAIASGEEAEHIPFYQPQGNECAIFEAAFRRRLPVLLKGPTGCGKTRFVAHMAARLGLPLDTIACHDDLTAADLTGRFLIKNNETVWTDGPLTRAVRRGGHLLSRRSGGGAQGRDRGAASAHRRPPHPAARPHRRDAARARRFHAGDLLQPRLPVGAENVEALDPPAFRRSVLRLSEARGGSGHCRARKRARRRDLQDPGPSRRPLARPERPGPRGRRLDPAAGRLRQSHRRWHEAQRGD